MDLPQPGAGATFLSRLEPSAGQYQVYTWRPNRNILKCLLTRIHRREGAEGAGRKRRPSIVLTLQQQQVEAAAGPRDFTPLQVILNPRILNSRNEFNSA